MDAKKPDRGLSGRSGFEAMRVERAFLRTEDDNRRCRERGEKDRQDRKGYVKMPPGSLLLCFQINKNTHRTLSGVSIATLFTLSEMYK